MRKKRTIFSMMPILSILLALMLGLSGCKANARQPLTCLDDFKERSLKIGMAEDLGLEWRLKEVCPQVQLEYYTDQLAVNAVANGKLDAFVCAKEILEQYLAGNPDLPVHILPEPLHTFRAALCLNNNTPVENYIDRVNECIRQMKNDGTLNDINRRWDEQGDETMPDIEMPEKPEYTLRVVTFGESKPHSYMKNGELWGSDIEIAKRVAAYLNCDIEWSTASYTAMLVGLEAGKYDMISANLYITDQRENSVTFSDVICENNIHLLVQNDENTPLPEYSSIAALQNAKKFAVISGTAQESLTKKYYPNAELMYLPSGMDELLALKGGKVDAFIHDAPILEFIANNNPGFYVLPDRFYDENTYFIFGKNEKCAALCSEFNEWLSEIRAEGTLDEMKEFWTGIEPPKEVYDFSSLPEVNGSLTISCYPNGRPDVFYFENSFTGYSIELAYRFCKDRGYSASLIEIPYESMVLALDSGKSDMQVGLLSYTDERAEKVLYSDPIYLSGMSALVRMKSSESEKTFFTAVSEGFKKTFITEERWRLVADGLGKTMLIAIGGFILANLFGATFCILAISKKKFSQMIYDAYSRLMQGTPIVVVLMILFYVIFGSNTISGVWVAILGFGLANGAILAQIFSGAISGVDKGQQEASLALGFTKTQTFFGIVLPQAIRTMLPAYFSAFIALMQSTSIVGYIAVVDLTKASDIIRSSTFEAFFPLLSVAVIYFLISAILLRIMKLLIKTLEPKSNRQEAAK